LHLARPRTRALVMEDLGLAGRLAEVQRRAFIFSKGVYTPYPFQANTFGLPTGVVAECLLGFIECEIRSKIKKRKSPRTAPRTFEDWILATFGEGIARHFMRPYNTKLWGVPPSRLTTEWMGRFVPRPRLEEVVRGALGRPAEGLGYNASFLYPRRGGIETLAIALASKVRVRRAAKVAGLDLDRRLLRLASGEELGFGGLITTAPLKTFLGLCRSLPASVKSAGRNLKSSHVLNVNLGVKNRSVSDKHWIYVPESEYPFYRVGFYHNFSPLMAPAGASALYTEAGYQGGPRGAAQKQAALAQAKQGLIKMGILKPSDRIEVEQVSDLRDAYVVYDAQRTPSVNTIQKFLQARNILSIGRWGNWEYSSMEDALWQGLEAGKKMASF
jgi:protoporphyrinogen oxidase